MGKCSQRVFFLIRDKPFGFLVGRGAVFPQLNSLKLENKSDKVKASIFCKHKSLFLKLQLALFTHV